MGRQKSVVVTGGTVRLGKVIADFLAKEGWRVLASSHRPDSGADIVADLSSTDGADRLFEEACRILGGVPDALVNNASLFSLGSDDFSQVNFLSPRHLVELMALRQGSVGAIVNILDTRILGREALTPYEKDKAALRDFTLEAARKYAGTLRVNAVAPGPVMLPQSVSEKAGLTPFGRPEPRDVAHAVSFLLSAKSTTGAIIPVDGGQAALCTQTPPQYFYVR